MNGKKYQAGLRIRRAVLGKEHVDRAIAEADEFSLPLQELVTEFGWGGVWARPGLSRKVRSLLNLAMLTALNRPHELRLHLRGAVRNGCTKKEIFEVFLQTSAYCGFPAAIDSFRVAKDFFLSRNGKARKRD